MSAHIIAHEANHIVFGLNWVPLSGEGSEKEEVVRHVREMNAAYQVKYAAEHAILYGFLEKADAPDTMAKGNRNKIISASVLLATFPDVAPNSIWVEVDGQTAKMAAIKDGLPLPLADFFGAIQEADERIRQIEQDSGIQFVMYGNYRDVYASTIEISFHELVSEGSVADATLGQASRGSTNGLS